MPQTVIPNPQRKEDPSVFDSPWEKLADKLVKAATFVVGETPQEQLLNTLTMGASGPLVSIYKNKAAREVGTGAFKQAATKIFPDPHRRLAAEHFAERYPRIAAHIDLRNPHVTSSYDGMLTREKNIVDSGSSWVPWDATPEGKKVVNLNNFRDILNQRLITKFTPPSEKEDLLLMDAISSMFHEGTHVAQSRMLPKMKELYNAIFQIRGKHADNPLEQNAFYSGAKEISRLFPKSLVDRFNDQMFEVPNAYQSLAKRIKKFYYDNQLQYLPESEFSKVITDYLNKRGLLP